MKNTYNYVADAVRKYWREAGIPQDVVVFFYQKYDHEKEWDKMCELVECDSSDDFEVVIFHSDFCEGQNCIKDLVIVPLNDIFDYYSKEVLKRNE